MQPMLCLVGLLLGSFLIGALLAGDRERVRRGLTQGAGQLVVWVGFAVAIAASVWAMLAFPPAILVVGPLFAVLMMPWLVVRTVLVPGGSYRVAWLLAQRAWLELHYDRQGGRALGAALAALRGPSTDHQAIPWVRSTIPRDDLRACSAVTLGLLAAEEGRIAEARELMRVALEFPPKAAPETARREAEQWLAAEAASRGAWAELRLQQRTRRPTRTTVFLRELGRRFEDGDAGPGVDDLRAAWLMTARWGATRPGLDLAIAHEPPPEVRPADGGVLQRAVHALARLEAADAGRCTLARLHDVGRVWDVALADPEVVAHLTERAEALGARPERAMQALTASVTGRLEAIASRAAPGPVVRRSPLADRALAGAREAAYVAVETAAHDLGERVVAERILPAADELAAWCRLRSLWDRATALGGDDARRALLDDVEQPLTVLYAHLANHDRQRALACTMARWSLRQARAAGFARSVTFHADNLRRLGAPAGWSTHP